MQRYAEHIPTCLDSHIEIEDRETWIVAPVSITRDTPSADQSNFYTALEMLGGESETVEVHRFGHWGPGWYEIIIVDPLSPQAKILEDIARSLEDYTLLDEDDYSRREHKDMLESWSNYGESDCRKLIESSLEKLFQDFDQTELDDPSARFCHNTGMPVDVCSCGDCHQTVYERIQEAIDKLDSIDLWEAFHESIEWHSDSGGICFRFSRLPLAWDAIEIIESIEV